MRNKRDGFLKGLSCLHQRKNTVYKGDQKQAGAILRCYLRLQVARAEGGAAEKRQGAYQGLSPGYRPCKCPQLHIEGPVLWVPSSMLAGQGTGWRRRRKTGCPYLTSGLKSSLLASCCSQARVPPPSRWRPSRPGSLSTASISSLDLLRRVEASCQCREVT